MKKKILAVFLSLCMAMSLLPVTALAADAADAKTPSAQATTTLPAAVNGVITLTGPVTLEDKWVPKEDVTLNLNGNTLTLPRLDAGKGVTITITDSQNGDGKIVATGTISAVVWSGGTLVLKDGTITSTNLSNSSNIAIFNMGTFTIKGGKVEGGTSGGTGVYNTVRNKGTYIKTPVICNIEGGEIEASYGVCAFGPGVPDGDLSKVNNNQVTINITGGEIKTNGQGIATNASSGQYAGFTINMRGGSIEDLDGASTGMYLPAIGVTNISGGSVTAAQAIRICAGELTINGGTIIGTAALSPDADLVSGGSGGTEGAIVIGKAGTGYVGNIEVNISENATVQNIATDGDVKPAIVVSDKNMALTNAQNINDPDGNKTSATFDYSKSGITVNVESQKIKGDVVKVSNNTAGKETKDGGNTSLTLTNANITGNVINQTKEGDVGISGSSITGNVTNKSKGEVVISNNSKIDGTVSNTGTGGDDEKGFVAILDSTVTKSIADADKNNITIVNSTVNNEPTTNTEGKVAMIGAKTYDTLQAAIEAAKDGDTIKLLDDVTVNAPTTKGQGAITINKGITLDGNGKTIKIGTGFEATGGEDWDKDFGKYHVLNITSDATIQNLTIDGDWAGMGKEVSTNYSAARTGINIWTNVDQLDVTLSGVTVKNCSVYAVTAKGAALTIIDLTTSGNQWGVDVEDNSTVSIEGSNIPENIVYENSSTDTDKNGLTITNGTYGNVVVQGASTNGKVTLNDGNYEGIDNKSTGGAVTIEVTDGSFKESVAQYVTSNLKYEANANGIYTYHKTLDEALAVSDTVSSVEAAKDGANAVTVTVKNGNDETKITLKKNDTYKLPTLPNQGYNRFQGWRSSVNGEVYPGGQEVTISADTTFTAQWAYIPPANPNYRIDIPAAEGGTVTADPAAAKAGATVTLTATPDEGYAVGTITVTDRFGDAVRVTEQADGTYTFTMPNGQVTVKATFVETQEPAPAEPFPDVDENDWFYDEVVYVYENGLMNGVENNQFAPNTATNRAMLATILYRLAGQPDVSGDLPFTDVAAGTWYTDAVLWAAQNGIVNGLGENTFAPMNTLTREQLVTMLYRYAEAEGYDVSAAADLSGYPDAGKVQPYAQEAMSWAVAEGIVEGMDGNLNPAGHATRAQIATILMRFCEGVAK